MPDVTAATYDELPYASHAFCYMHPNALARVGILAGLDPAPVENCRVLELGCAIGRNIIPMAEGLPGATCVGIDISPRQIEEGRRTVEELGLRNVRLEAMSILDLTPEFGQFDYIVCHGVYSWVPPEVQAKILDVCRENLAPRGLACVSYNVYPGWHLRRMTREMMLYHGNAAAPLASRVREARELMEALVAGTERLGHQESAHAAVLRDDLRTVRSAADEYICHEYLEPNNDPIYFHQFVERAAAKGLRHVGSATDDYGWARAQWVIDSMDPPLLTGGGDPIRREQYLDFLVGREFRASVLSRGNNTPTGEVDALAALEGLSVVAAFGAVDAPAGAPPGALAFANEHGTTVTVNEPIVRAAMMALAEAAPAAVRFDALCHQTARQLGLPDEVLPDQGRRLLANSLIRSHRACLVEFFPYLPPCATTARDRPLASGFARFLAAREQSTLTNRRHESVIVTVPLDYLVLPLLDGTRDRAAILQGVQDALAARAAAGRPLDPPPAPEALPELIEQSIRRIGRSWLLIG